jgi:hypothetical protein
MLISDSGMIQIKSAKCCVVYDANSGDIVHVHHVINLSGAQEPNDDEIKRSALDMASAEKGRSRFEALMVAPERFDSSVAYQVDLKTGELVRVRRSPLPES